MKRNSTLALAAALLLLTACSDSDNNSDGNADNKQAAAPQSQAAAPSPQASAPAGQQLSPQQQAALDAAKDMPKQGTVLEMLHATGYTYMKVDTGEGEPVWIAASIMRIKPKQTVRWADAAVMKNFASKSLHRTFDEILFVSNASVVE